MATGLSTRRRLLAELAALGTVAVLAYVSVARGDRFEALVRGAFRNDRLDVPGLASAIVAVMTGVAVLAWRRRLETRQGARGLEQTRVELEETNDRYRSLFTHNPHGVYSMDLDGRFLSVNRAAQGLAGYDEGDLIGNSFVDLLVPDYVEATVALFNSAAAGTPHRMETAIHRPDGERVDLNVNVSPIVVGDAIVGVYGVAEDITARKRMERELHRTQEAVAAALDGVMIGDEADRVSYANEASVRLHGCASVDDMIGKSLGEFLDAHDALPAVMAALDEDGRWAGQLTGHRRDKSSFAVEASLSKLPDGCIIAITRDVTARLEADAVLRLSEERYRTVLADIAGGYFETDRDGTLTFVNEELAQLAGGTRAEVIGTNVYSYAAHDALTTMRRHANRVARTGRTDPGFDWHLVRLDGTRRLVSASLAVRRGDADEAVGFRGLVRDMTEREEVRRALVLSEERHQLVARVTREVIWDRLLPLGQTTWSGAIEDVFGFPDDEVLVPPRWWESRIHPDDVSAVLASVDSALASTDDRWSHEYRLRDAHDDYVTVLSRARITRDEEGRAIRFTGSMMDITAYRRQQEELRLARRLAEQANEAKSHFLANVSHELRTPLTSVIAATEMVMDTPLTPPQQRLLERVGRSGERLLKLVDDLLDFSKIEAGDLRMDVVPFDPAEVVQQSATWAQEACAARRLEFALSVETLPRPLTGDPDRLCQVLTNLLGNAIKFTPSGQVSLDVRVTDESPAHTTIRFTVHDTGIGIDPAHQADIFRSFNQADPSITRNYGGNGLGLAIAKEIVESMGGTIGVESAPGQGSRFHFQVPFMRSGSGSANGC